MSFGSGLNIIGQQFVAVGGEAADIQTIKGEGLDAGGGDFIRIWDATERRYTDYSYYPGATANINGDGKDAWGDDDWQAVSVDIPAGTGMWINAQNSAYLRYCGEVTSNTTVSFVPGLNLICAPQPVDVVLQDVVGTGMDPSGGDFIRLWDSAQNRYTDYSYYPGTTANIKGDGTDAWGDDDWTPVDVTIPAGQGFWLNAQGSGTLTFPNALAPANN